MISLLNTLKEIAQIKCEWGKEYDISNQMRKIGDTYVIPSDGIFTIGVYPINANIAYCSIYKNSLRLMGTMSTAGLNSTTSFAVKKGDVIKINSASNTDSKFFFTPLIITNGGVLLSTKAYQGFRCFS